MIIRGQDDQQNDILPRVLHFPTLVFVNHQLITITHIIPHTRTLVQSIHHGRLLCSIQFGAACHKIHAPWNSPRYWVRGTNRKIDVDADFQTMSTRLALTLPCASISFCIDVIHTLYA
jgi:hypothetical protein